jgi:hypothetical protein
MKRKPVNRSATCQFPSVFRPPSGAGSYTFETAKEREIEGRKGKSKGMLGGHSKRAES